MSDKQDVSEGGNVEANVSNLNRNDDVIDEMNEVEGDNEMAEISNPSEISDVINQEAEAEELEEENNDSLLVSFSDVRVGGQEALGCDRVSGGSMHRNDSNDSVEVADRISQIKAVLKQPFGFVGFSKVIKLLNEMRNLRGSEDLESLVTRTECELHLGRGKQGDVMKKMTELVRNSQGPTLVEVLRNSKNHNTHGRPLAALILRFLWCDLYDSSDQTPDVAAGWIANNVEEVKTMTMPFVTAGGRYRGIAIEFCLKKMEAMLENLRKRQDLDTHRALQEGRCVLNLVQVYQAAKLYSKVISVGLEGVRILALALGAQVLAHSVYGRLLNYVGMAYGCSGRPTEAEVHFVQAREACIAARDFENLEEKRTEIGRAIVGLAIANETFLEN